MFKPEDVDKDDAIYILETTEEAQAEFGYAYGASQIVLSKKHIDALLAGKMLAWTDGEYNTFVITEDTLSTLSP